MGRGNPRKKVITPMGNMARITTNRPIGTTRSKSKVNGLGKLKERGNKPNGPTWQE